MWETVTKITREQTGVDRYNQPVFEDVEADVPDVAVAPAGSSTDPQTGAVTTTRNTTLYLPDGVTSAPDDRWRVRGIVYAVTGASADWPTGFSSWTPGNVVVLEDTEYVDGS